jgi:hypothetical protein
LLLFDRDELADFDRDELADLDRDELADLDRDALPDFFDPPRERLPLLDFLAP